MLVPGLILSLVTSKAARHSDSPMTIRDYERLYRHPFERYDRLHDQ
jgi:hypothetical protein